LFGFVQLMFSVIDSGFEYRIEIRIYS